MHRKKLSKIVIVVLLTSLTLTAQTQKPCAKAELRAAMAESQLAAERARAETTAALNAQLESEIASLKQELSRAGGVINETQAKLGAEQKQAANLSASNAELSSSLASSQQKVSMLESKLAEADKVNTAQAAWIKVITAQWAKAQRDAKRANKRTWAAVIVAAVIGTILEVAR